MRVTWDPAKSRANKAKHGVSFAEAQRLFTSDIDYLEIFDDEHADSEDRFFASDRSGAGSFSSSLPNRTTTWSVLSAPAGLPGASAPSTSPTWRPEMIDPPELSTAQFARAISARHRRRLMAGLFETGADVTALRRFVGLTQARFAQAIGISIHTLRNWEQGRRRPEGPAVALLRIAARHPRIIRENLETAA